MVAGLEPITDEFADFVDDRGGGGRSAQVDQRLQHGAFELLLGGLVGAGVVIRRGFRGGVGAVAREGFDQLIPLVFSLVPRCQGLLGSQK